MTDGESRSDSEQSSGEQSDPRDSGDGDDAETDAPAVDRPKPPGEDDEDDVQPVEVLVQLAKDDEIEPWDIDIVTVTDKFLARLDEADLRTSGRALFYASVLLRMKSDALLEPDESEEEGEPADAEAG